MLGFFLLIAVAFATYSVATTENYRRLRVSEVSQTVAFEGERVDKIIAEMERNAVGLALAGRQFYSRGGQPAEMGVFIVLENIAVFRAAVGGGIWFEPYALDVNERRLCYYAFFDPADGAVRHDPAFESEEYDYHTQSWYVEIATQLDGKNRAVWTPPYYDAAGAHSLMTTVGAGIYDNDGRLVGMSTVDWQIQSVVDRLSAIRPTDNSFVLLASPQGDRVIANTHKNAVNHQDSSFRALPWHSELNLAEGEVVGRGRFVKDGVEYVSFSRPLGNGWLFSVQVPAREIYAEIETRNALFIRIIASASLGLLILAFYLLSRFISRPLRALMAGVSELGGGNLDRRIKVGSRDEIGMLATAFNKMTVDLKVSIEENARERAAKERIGAELNVATRIQAGMLPCIFPAFPNRSEFDLYASMQPAAEVGGDFYDFFMVDDNTLAVVIADVSGKGVPAALFMVIAKTLIKNSAQSNKNLQDVLGKVNNLLCENNEADMFVTVFLGCLDIPSGRFSFVNAGHNPPLLRSGGRFDWLKADHGLVLAGMEGTSYKQNEITLLPGDELFLYTDGVTEAMNGTNELFGEERLLGIANDHPGLSPKEFIATVKREIEEFAAGTEQADDITMLALQYNGRKPT